MDSMRAAPRYRQACSSVYSISELLAVLLFGPRWLPFRQIQRLFCAGRYLLSKIL